MKRLLFALCLLPSLVFGANIDFRNLNTNHFTTNGYRVGLKNIPTNQTVAEFTTNVAVNAVANGPFITRAPGTNAIGTNTSFINQVNLVAAGIWETNLAAPGAPTVAVGGAGVLSGDYVYQVVFVTTNGETTAGTLSATVSPSSQAVNVSGIPTGSYGVIARKIYRTEFVGGSTTLFLTNIANNTTTSFTDNTADSALGGRPPVFNTTAGVRFINGVRYFYVDPSDSGNLFVGYNAGVSNAVGNRNTALGYSAQTALTNGSANTSSGAESMRYFRAGDGNTGHGAGTLDVLVQGSFNTAVGQDSQGELTNGSRNASVGRDALWRMLEGEGNTSIGDLAGENLRRGTNNIYIGERADGPTNISYSMAQGHFAHVTKNRQWVVGTNSSIGYTQAVFNVGNLGINTNAPEAPLDVYGAIKSQGAVPGVLLWNPDVFAGLDFAGAELYLMGAQLILTTNPVTGGISDLFARRGSIYMESDVLGRTNYFSNAGVGNAHRNQTFDILQGPDSNVDATWRFGTQREFGPTTTTQNLASASAPIASAWINSITMLGTGPGTITLTGTNPSSSDTIRVGADGNGITNIGYLYILPKSNTAPSLRVDVIAGQTNNAISVVSNDVVIASVSNGGRVRANGGVISAPGLSMHGDPDSGFYPIADNDWGLAMGGVRLLDITGSYVEFTQGLIAFGSALDAFIRRSAVATLRVEAVNGLLVSAGNSGQYASVGGALGWTGTYVTNSGSGETTVFATNILANTMTNAGQSYMFMAAGKIRTSANNKRIRVYLAGTLLYDSTAQNPLVATDWGIRGDIISKGTNAYEAFVGLTTSGGNLFTFSGQVTGAEDLRTNNTFTVTLTGGATDEADIRMAKTWFSGRP